MLRNPTLKKGELTFSQIVIAVISIIVLIVLILIFTGSIGPQSDRANSCAINLGKCQDNQTSCPGMILPGSFTDCKQEDVCCVSPMGRSSDD